MTLTGPFSLLTTLYPDDDMAALWTPTASVQRWVRVEHALARAQAKVGILSDADAAAICDVSLDDLDLEALWLAARNVGYPVLPLVRQIAATLPEGPDGRVHYGATTQDIMDTGLALQARDACDLLARRIGQVGDALCIHVARHRDTVMAARTHGQQAVPTTFGAELAPALVSLARNRDRLTNARNSVSVVSLFGAGGTSAALGSRVRQLRAWMAEDLDLAASHVSWHNTRDRIVGLAHSCVLLVGVCAGLARNVVDLSRTEIGELHESVDTHRGASSTMPQKANPILAEGVIGMSATVGSLVATLGRSLEVPQERAAGEWHIEWHVVPQVLQLTASTLTATHEMLAGLRVDTAAMRRNLEADGALVMSEAAMITLADRFGREYAHDIIYEAALDVRAGHGTLAETIVERLHNAGQDVDVTVPRPEQYLGEAGPSCDHAVDIWHGERTEGR